MTSTNENGQNSFDCSKKFLDIENVLCIELNNINFISVNAQPEITKRRKIKKSTKDITITHIYNPLHYAKKSHENFIKKYFECSSKKILFLGINPGPWGMCQTGIAFGEINVVRDWFGIAVEVDKPESEHPKKKIYGHECIRSEPSGKKLWNFFKKLCITPENFFKHSFVYNYCPIAFVESSGKNITPEDIKDKKIKNQLIEECDKAFVNILQEFNFEKIVGIGRYSEERAKDALQKHKITNVQVIYIPHPSNRSSRRLYWEVDTLKIMKENDLLKYFTENQSLITKLSEEFEQCLQQKKNELKNG